MILSQDQTETIAKHKAAASAWREAAAYPYQTEYMRQLCLRAAAEQDRRANGEPGKCLCCGKTTEQHNQRMFAWMQ